MEMKEKLNKKPVVNGGGKIVSEYDSYIKFLGKKVEKCDIDYELYCYNSERREMLFKMISSNEINDEIRSKFERIYPFYNEISLNSVTFEMNVDTHEWEIKIKVDSVKFTKFEKQVTAALSKAIKNVIFKNHEIMDLLNDPAWVDVEMAALKQKEKEREEKEERIEKFNNFLSIFQNKEKIDGRYIVISKKDLKEVEECLRDNIFSKFMEIHENETVTSSYYGYGFSVLEFVPFGSEEIISIKYTLPGVTLEDINNIIKEKEGERRSEERYRERMDHFDNFVNNWEPF